jgi:hypothetical protein
MFRSTIIAGAALFMSIGVASAQTPLSAYQNKNGYLLVQQLTCKQLANTYQEDAEWLIIWYSGWYNGLGKKSAVNVPRVKRAIPAVIRACKADQDKKIIQVIGALLKEEKK